MSRKEFIPIPTASVAIVLGAAVKPGGQPSPSLNRRALHGACLVKTGKASFLIASGGIGRFPPSEASVIRDIALAEGVSPDRIILDERSKTTLESAINCSIILNRNGWFSAIIVTDRFHLFRSVFLFRRLGIDASGNAPDWKHTGTSRWRWYYLHIREIFAIPLSMVRIYMYRLISPGR